jgi:hypothetical protein
VARQIDDVADAPPRHVDAVQQLSQFARQADAHVEPSVNLLAHVPSIRQIMEISRLKCLPDAGDRDHEVP